MDVDQNLKFEPAATQNHSQGQDALFASNTDKSKEPARDGPGSAKRRCVSTACIACRRRKSKCDGNLPKCAACASVYLTECEYAPHTDHRRKGVYKKDADTVKTKNSTLQILVQALLNSEEDDAVELLKQMRLSDNLEELAQEAEARLKGIAHEPPESPANAHEPTDIPQFDAELSNKMGDLLLDGSVKFIGGTSNLVWLDDSSTVQSTPSPTIRNVVRPNQETILSWTTVTHDKELVLHFLNMYFCWHYPYFTTLSKELFYRDFLTGTSSQYCSAILVNAMLALGCHFSSKPQARAVPDDSSTIGDHFFAEAKRLLYGDEEFANAKLCNVQALALMSVREAGCGRENKGWVYSGMSFRMASDLGLNVDVPAMNQVSKLSDEDIDARRITFWGCYLFDKCWSNYLGRQPQLQLTHSNTKKFEVFPPEESEMWSPYTDAGILNANAQPARTRVVALQISKLAEISSDLLISFYQPSLLEKPLTKQAELKRLSDIHTRLESWKQELPAELEPQDGQLPSVLLMHMFFQLLYIHLYRPFLRYTKATSPLPAHISPRKFCTQAAGTISKLLRLYKRTHSLRQIINKVVYIAHSACTIHLLNLPEKNARRDIVHGVKHLEEIGEMWTAARRTIRILAICADRWSIELPDEAHAAFNRTKARWGSAEPAAGPISPNTMTSISQQVTGKPIPDLMAHNIQEHQRFQQRSSSFPQQRQKHQQTALLPQTTQILGVSGQAPTTPLEDPERRRLSEVIKEPPQSIANAARPVARARPSTHLTKEQQEAWHNLQARMTQSTRTEVPAHIPGSANAASLFGGVDRLIEETQDWWYDDQTQLAQGFDNWTGPTGDWSHLPNATTATTGMSFGDMGSLPAIGTNGLFAPQEGVLNDQYGSFSSTNTAKSSFTNGANVTITPPANNQSSSLGQQHSTSHRKRALAFQEDEIFY